MTHVLLLGFSIGLLSILPPGPVTLTLIEVGAAQGRQRGAQGGLGVAAGDLVAALCAALLVLAGTTLPPSLFAGLQLLSSVVLLGLGVALVARPSAVHGLAVGITHPTRAFFLLTALTPTVLGAWVAIIGAMPFADDRRSVVLFVVGAMAASLLWHLLVDSAAGDLGGRIPQPAMRRLSQVGGGALILFGALTLVG